MGKLRSTSTSETTAIGVVQPRCGTCLFGKCGRNHVPTPWIDGNTLYPLSATDGSSSRARANVHGAAAHNMEHPAPGAAAPECTHSSEPATWAPPTRKVGLGTSQGRPKATPKRSGGPHASPRGEIWCTTINTKHALIHVSEPFALA